MMVNHFLDRVSGDEDARSVYALAQQVLTAALSVRHKHTADVVNDAAIGFLRHAKIEAAVPCFHVVDRNAHASRHDCSKAAVGIAKNQQPVRPMFCQKRLNPRQDLSHLLSETAGPHVKTIVGLAHSEVAEKQTVEAIIIVLAGIYQKMLAVLIQHADDEA